MMLSLVSTILRASKPLLPLLLLKCSQLQAEVLQASTDPGAISLGRSRGLETQAERAKARPSTWRFWKTAALLGKANLLLAPLMLH